MALNQVHGECPYCGKAGIVAMDKQVRDGGVTCPACRQRILVRDKQFTRIP